MTLKAGQGSGSHSVKQPEDKGRAENPSEQLGFGLHSQTSSTSHESLSASDRILIPSGQIVVHLNNLHHQK